MVFGFSMVLFYSLWLVFGLFGGWAKMLRMLMLVVWWLVSGVVF